MKLKHFEKKVKNKQVVILSDKVVILPEKKL